MKPIPLDEYERLPPIKADELVAEFCDFLNGARETLDLSSLAKAHGTFARLEERLLDDLYDATVIDESGHPARPEYTADRDADWDTIRDARIEAAKAYIIALNLCQWPDAEHKALAETFLLQQGDDLDVVYADSQGILTMEADEQTQFHHRVAIHFERWSWRRLRMTVFLKKLEAAGQHRIQALRTIH